MNVRIKKILLPMDFSECSAHAFQYAVFLARQFEARIDLLHVVEDVALTQHITVTVDHVDELLDGVEKEAKRQIKEFHRKRVPKDLRATLRVVRGTPFLEILRCSRQKKSDLIVMGTHGRTGLAHVLMGSTAETVVRKSAVPVLTVKLPGQRFRHP